MVTVDGQGPTYANAAETLAVAEAEVRALAADREVRQPA